MLGDVKQICFDYSNNLKGASMLGKNGQIILECGDEFI